MLQARTTVFRVVIDEMPRAKQILESPELRLGDESDLYPDFNSGKDVEDVEYLERVKKTRLKSMSWEEFYPLVKHFRYIKDTSNIHYTTLFNTIISALSRRKNDEVLVVIRATATKESRREYEFYFIVNPEELKELKNALKLDMSEYAKNSLGEEKSAISRLV